MLLLVNKITITTTYEYVSFMLVWFANRHTLNIKNRVYRLKTMFYWKLLFESSDTRPPLRMASTKANQICPLSLFNFLFHNRYLKKSSSSPSPFTSPHPGRSSRQNSRSACWAGEPTSQCGPGPCPARWSRPLTVRRREQWTPGRGWRWERRGRPPSGTSRGRSRAGGGSSVWRARVWSPGCAAPASRSGWRWGCWPAPAWGWLHSLGLNQPPIVTLN